MTCHKSRSGLHLIELMNEKREQEGEAEGVPRESVKVKMLGRERYLRSPF